MSIQPNKQTHYYMEVHLDFEPAIVAAEAADNGIMQFIHG